MPGTGSTVYAGGDFIGMGGLPQAYIAAMPGWKHDVGRQLDALIEGME